MRYIPGGIAHPTGNRHEIRAVCHPYGNRSGDDFDI